MLKAASGAIRARRRPVVVVAMLCALLVGGLVVAGGGDSGRTGEVGVKTGGRASSGLTGGSDDRVSASEEGGSGTTEEKRATRSGRAGTAETGRSGAAGTESSETAGGQLDDPANPLMGEQEQADGTATGPAGGPSGAAPTEEEASSSGPDYLVAARQQRSDGRTIVIHDVVFSGKGGFVAIHADEGGHNGIRGASAYLPKGTHHNVKVTLNPPLSSTSVVLPMLHADDNANRSYDFPAADGPVNYRGDTVTTLVRIDVG